MTQETEDKKIERHFMRALDVAIRDKGLNYTRAEAAAGLAGGTISHWMSGSRMPNALRFAQVAHSLGIDPGALMDDGWRRAREAGLLEGVQVTGAGEESREDFGSADS